MQDGVEMSHCLRRERGHLPVSRPPAGWSASGSLSRSPLFGSCLRPLPLYARREPGIVTTGLLLAVRCDQDGQIVNQWLRSNFVAMLEQIGWGVAPVGETVSPPH
jgi:hypothetical protein